MDGAGSARRSTRPAVRYGADGLVAAVVQDADDGRVLMVAWQDAEAIDGHAADRRGALPLALARTPVAQGRDERQHAARWSACELDCDADAVLIRRPPGRPDLPHGRPLLLRRRARWPGAAGAGSTARPTGPGLRLARDALGDHRRARPDAARRAPTRARLLDGGVDAVGPQGRRGGDRGAHGRQGRRGGGSARRAAATTGRLAGELADLLYHALVLCAERGLEPSAVMEALQSRHAR